MPHPISTPTGQRFNAELCKLRYDLTDLHQRIAEWGSQLQSNETQELDEAKRLFDTVGGIEAVASKQP